MGTCWPRSTQSFFAVHQVEGTRYDRQLLYIPSASITNSSQRIATKKPRAERNVIMEIRKRMRMHDLPVGTWRSVSRWSLTSSLGVLDCEFSLLPCRSVVSSQCLLIALSFSLGGIKFAIQVAARYGKERACWSWTWHCPPVVRPGLRRSAAHHRRLLQSSVRM
jgi:hypothetical protein